MKFCSVDIQRAASAAVKMLFTTLNLSPAHLEPVLSRGEMGYLLKSSVRDEILDAIKTALEGRVSPPVLGKELGDFYDHSLSAATTIRLSERERQVLQLIARGKACKEVAFALSISVKTVGFHRENIKHKLGVGSTAELTRYAIHKGLV